MCWLHGSALYHQSNGGAAAQHGVPRVVDLPFPHFTSLMALKSFGTHLLGYEYKTTSLYLL